MEKSNWKTLRPKFKTEELPVVEALEQLINASFEAELMIRSCLRQRDVKIEVVRTYKDKTGKSYQKAQKAAIEADYLTERATAFRQMKIELWSEVARLYGLYSGDPVKGVIVAYWLIKNKSVDDIVVYAKRDRTFVESTLKGLKVLFEKLTYCRELIPERYEKLLRKSSSNSDKQ